MATSASTKDAAGNDLSAVEIPLGGAIILSQVPTPLEIVGCVLMFSATVISQIGGEKQ